MAVNVIDQITSPSESRVCFAINRLVMCEREHIDIASFGEDYLMIYQPCGHRLAIEGCDDAAESSSAEL
jgi:hypothetical protein